MGREAGCSLQTLVVLQCQTFSVMGHSGLCWNCKLRLGLRWSRLCYSAWFGSKLWLTFCKNALDIEAEWPAASVWSRLLLLRICTVLLRQATLHSWSILWDTLISCSGQLISSLARIMVNIYLFLRRNNLLRQSFTSLISYIFMLFRGICTSFLLSRWGW